MLRMGWVGRCSCHGKAMMHGHLESQIRWPVVHPSPNDPTKKPWASWVGDGWAHLSCAKMRLMVGHPCEAWLDSMPSHHSTGHRICDSRWPCIMPESFAFDGHSPSPGMQDGWPPNPCEAWNACILGGWSPTIAQFPMEIVSHAWAISWPTHGEKLSCARHSPCKALQGNAPPSRWLHGHPSMGLNAHGGG